MQLTKAEKRVYAVVGLFLAGLLVSAVFDLSYFVLSWLFLVVPLVFALAFAVSLWRGTRR